MSNTTNKKPSPAIVIMKRELATYFTNPISYIVTGLFLIITGVMFFTTFFLQNRARINENVLILMRWSGIIIMYNCILGSDMRGNPDNTGA